jgi:hypothetical protein
MESQAVRDGVGRVQPKGGSHGKARHLQRDGISGGMQDVKHPRDFDGVHCPPRQVQPRVCGHGTKREVAHVVALLKQVRKAAESGT